MPSFFKRNKKTAEADAPAPAAQSQDVPDIPAGMSQRRPASTTTGNYVPRNPSNLSFGPMFANQMNNAEVRKQPRPFKSYRLRGEYVVDVLVSVLLHYLTNILVASCHGKTTHV